MPKKKRRPTPLSKKEVAKVKAFNELGFSQYAVAKRTGFSAATVRKYLANAEAYSTPDMQNLVDQIKEKEILDLTVLTVEARDRLHILAPHMNPIEAIALMDRSFQQRRLLEGKSTANIATLTQIIKDAHGAVVSSVENTAVSFDETKRQPIDVEVEINGSQANYS